MRVQRQGISGNFGTQKARETVRVTKMDEEEQQRTGDQIDPKLLYHYTTQEGLLGILEKWGSCLSTVDSTGSVG